MSAIKNCDNENFFLQNQTFAHCWLDWADQLSDLDVKTKTKIK